MSSQDRSGRRKVPRGSRRDPIASAREAPRPRAWALPASSLASSRSRSRSHVLHAGAQWDLNCAMQVPGKAGRGGEGSRLGPRARNFRTRPRLGMGPLVDARALEPGTVTHWAWQTGAGGDGRCPCRSSTWSRMTELCSRSRSNVFPAVGCGRGSCAVPSARAGSSG